MTLQALLLKRGGILICSVVAALNFSAATTFAAHRDPAPIPDEVVERLANNRQGGDDPLALALGRHLDEATELLRQMEDEDNRPVSSDSVVATKRMLLAAKGNELTTLRSEIRAKLAETRGRLVSLGFIEKVREWDALRLQVEERFERITRALAEVKDAPDKRLRGKAAASARRELHDLHGKVKEREQSLGDTPLPTWKQDERSIQLPDYDHAAPPVYLLSQPRTLNNLYAFSGNTLLAALPDPVPSEALSCGYTAADLGESQEVKLTPEIKALAEQLGYSPARIFEYVANEIRFEPYYGSLKGATGTLVAKGGNATDQASLLIALLRAANIPSRYVKGTANFVNDPRIQRWVGAKSYTAAANILGMGGIPYAFDSATSTVQFTHVWVEACVPYAHYRGARLDNAGHRWIPLDPSFKDKSYQAGITTSVNFDYTNYLAARTNTLPFEAYEQQVESAIKTLAPYYNNNTLEDVPYAGRQILRRVDILPASPPYEIVNFGAWGGGITTSDTAEVPDIHRNKFTVIAMNSAGTTLATTTLSLPETALSRTTLSFKGATTADQTALDAWRNDNNLNSAIPCTINVVPVIKSEGVDKAVGTSSVGLCTIDNQLTLTVSLAELTTPTLNSITYRNIGAANYHALQAYAFQTSDRLLSERSKRLLDTVRATANPNTNQEETEGEFLHLVGLKYMRYASDSLKRIGELDGGSGESGNNLGLTTARMKVQYLFDLPFAVNREGFLVDMPGLLCRNRDLSTGGAIWKTFKLSGYAASAYESYIWQENSRLDAVSTVRGLQFAKESGIEILTLTSANWAANSSKFTTNANSALNYAQSQVDSIKTSYIDQGYTVTIPRSLIQYQNWKGAVYVAEKNNISVDGTARATYAIGQYAGGYTVSTPVSYSYNPSIDTGYVQASFGPTSGTPPLSAGNGAVGPGFTPYNPFEGDPVNMVTGNMYHTERDLAVKGRGGLPIVFERAYNSRNAQDGPLGFGWTHSFNHYLSFKDDNYNGTGDAADTDGITSAVSWTDGTGSEKFRWPGMAAGCPWGAPSPRPRGSSSRCHATETALTPSARRTASPIPLKT
ncbi:MAG: hypothetical protein FD174_2684 [Geobacteraceae bacterium]|nr:MAG: hypothetical protein FD174_2684 [Geobacteraceae bacterium]